MDDRFVEQGGNNPRVPSKEELLLIRDSIFLPIILDIAEKNRQQMERSSNTFKLMFLKAITVFMDSVTKDLAKVKRELKQRNIKVIEDNHVDQVMYFRFICRGYEERFGMIKEVVRAEISVRMGSYMKQVI